MPAIIDEPTCQDARAQLDRNATLSFRNNTRNDYLLRCLLTCRTCGLAMFGTTQQRRPADGPAPVLQMPRQGLHSGPRPGPALHATRVSRAEELEAAVWAHVKQSSATPRPCWASSRPWPGEAEGGTPPRRES